MNPARSRWSLLASLTATLLLWEIAGRAGWVAGGALPAPSAIVEQWWWDRGDYPAHLRASGRNALAGFLIGNVVAVAFAVLFTLVPLAERLLRGVLVALFCMPLIVVAPIVGVAYDGETPKVILAALAVFFPPMVATLVGLRGVDPSSVDVVRSVGGGARDVLWRLRIRTALPAFVSGLRVAAPAALLGAILGEFLGGRYGLGVYLLGSLGQAVPARIWGIGLAATVVAGAGYGVFALLGRRLLRTTTGPTVSTRMSGELAAGAGRSERAWLDPLLGLASIGVALGLWWVYVVTSGLPTIIAKRPADLWEYLVTGPASGTNRAALWSAFAESLPVAALGLACGLAAALGLALLSTLAPALARTLLPIALVTQTMPLIALTPLLVLLLGRGMSATVAVTVSVTFFPSFVTIAQGLALTPTSILDVVRSVNGSRFTELRKVGLPGALPYLFVAARLATPRALLGVVIAEYLATGAGLGGLLAASRGKLAYGMLWSIAVTVAVVSVVLYLGLAALERRVLRRFAAAG
jgi:ABC-type nitrate/sulfonate/bicarbonate transport system permease component